MSGLGFKLSHSCIDFFSSINEFAAMLRFSTFAIASYVLALGACTEAANDSFGAPPVPEDPLSYAATKSAAPLSAFEHANKGRQYLDKGLYGLAESEFRASVELKPQNAEAWLGLAAAYDNLRRFDLADRAYLQVRKLLGPSAEVLNNEGYSQLMRGNFRKARALFLKAQRMDPNNVVVQRNLARLDAAQSMNMPQVR
jgi:Flp pilus assembly protein TadD